MVNAFRRSLAGLFILCLSLPCAVALGAIENEKTLGQALKKGQYGISLRYRYENVAQDGFASDARASTLRTALSYRSARFRDWVVALELEDVTDIGAGRLHNNLGAGSLSNGVTDRPAVADPEVTDINQFHLDYHRIPGTVLQVGRQEIDLGNQRFVGAVGWRQNHQSFDAVRVDVKPLSRARFTYAYLRDSSLINGGTRGLDGHAFNVAIDAGKWGLATPYLYEFDFDAATAAGLSTRTVGASWEGKAGAGSWKLPYRVELARQDDTGANPNSVDAGYVNLELTAERGGLTLTGGYEVLQGDPSEGAFSTPLATLHRFNGWADKFLTTPANGLRDLSFTVGYGWRAWSTAVTYHDFAAESQGPDHGTEVDGVVSYNASWGQTFGARFALFEADAGGTYTDTDKLWVFSGYSF